MIGASIK